MKINFIWKKQGRYIDNLVINDIEVGYVEYIKENNLYVAWRSLRSGVTFIGGYSLITKQSAKKYLINDVTKFITELMKGIII